MLRAVSAGARSGPMQAHEVMKEVLKRTSAKQIAAEMHLSLSLIYKWAEPPEDESGSGATSPLDRVGQLVRASGDAGLSARLALAEVALCVLLFVACTLHVRWRLAHRTEPAA